MRICFDMDGTIANLYEVEGWLDDIFAENAKKLFLTCISCDFLLFFMHFMHRK